MRDLSINEWSKAASTSIPRNVDRKVKSSACSLKSIVSFLADNMAKDGLVCLIQYGSSLISEDPNDYDFIALCDKVLGTYPVEVGPVDLCKIGLKQFDLYLRNMDPVYCTEPLLTGEVVSGNEQMFLNLRNEIRTRRAGLDTVSYLVRQSVIQYSAAVNLVEITSPFEALYSLKFSVGYHMFANWYEKGNAAATLSHLTNQLQNDWPRSLFRRVASGKREGLAKEEVVHFIKTWEKFMASSDHLFERGKTQDNPFGA